MKRVCYLAPGQVVAHARRVSRPKPGLKPGLSHGTSDPLLCQGWHARHLEKQFWQYASGDWLEAFARVASSGDLGPIDAFEGKTRYRDGQGWQFSWQRGGKLAVRPCKPPPDSGRMVLVGRFDFEKANRIRNFPLFHLRDEAIWLI